jgi:uncharacterized protein YbjT (DUF2867 family)
VSALEQQGKPVRAVVRDPAKYKQSHGSARQGVEVVAGDVGSTDSLRQALKGCSDVIFAASGSGYFSAREVDCEVGWSQHPGAAMRPVTKTTRSPTCSNVNS